MVLLVALEHDVFRLGMSPQRRVEDLLLDDLVERQLAFDRREQLRPRLDPTLGRRFELGEQPLHLDVIGLEHGDGIHGRDLLGGEGVGWCSER